MKIHLLEFYPDIQDNSSFVNDENIEMLIHLIDSLKEQRFYYMQVPGYDIQVSQFLKRYIKTLEEYRDNILFKKNPNEEIKIDSILMDIKLINNWLYERGKRDNLEIYNLSELFESVGNNLNLTNYIY
jgi:chloramphenicol O-acetyltransferase